MDSASTFHIDIRQLRLPKVQFVRRDFRHVFLLCLSRGIFPRVIFVAWDPSTRSICFISGMFWYNAPSAIIITPLPRLQVDHGDTKRHYPRSVPSVGKVDASATEDNLIRCIDKVSMKK